MKFSLCTSSNPETKKQMVEWRSKLLLDKRQSATHLLETFTEILQNFDLVENFLADSN
jgi:hypothetical protein